mmetsp:Transcript_19098/g.31965  ORF Transcript_19098/g.31965 Transcript_19098/m.31965 type:complete len:293 (-) Transcript_19098:1327-2205(-)
MLLLRTTPPTLQQSRHVGLFAQKQTPENIVHIRGIRLGIRVCQYSIVARRERHLEKLWLRVNHFVERVRHRLQHYVTSIDSSSQWSVHLPLLASRQSLEELPQEVADLAVDVLPVQEGISVHEAGDDIVTARHLGSVLHARQKVSGGEVNLGILQHRAVQTSAFFLGLALLVRQGQLHLFLNAMRLVRHSAPKVIVHINLLLVHLQAANQYNKSHVELVLSLKQQRPLYILLSNARLVHLQGSRNAHQRAAGHMSCRPGAVAWLGDPYIEFFDATGGISRFSSSSDLLPLIV